MPHYKDLQNKLHCVEREFAHVLPAGCVEISDEEAAALNAPTPEQVAAQAAAELEAATDIANRETAKQFARLTALRTMNPAQVSGYIASRYPAPAGNLADANTILIKMRDDIETLAIAVSVLARRL